MDSFWAAAAAVLRRVGSVLRLIWEVIYQGLAIEDVVLYVTIDMVEAYRDGWIIIRRAILWWLGISLLVIILNIAWFHQMWIWTVVGLINIPITAILLIWGAPIAIAGACLTALVHGEGNHDWSPSGIVSWLTRRSGEYWKRAVANTDGYFRVVGWVLIIEILAIVYVRIFPVWRNPSMFLLLLSAVSVIAILSRQTMGAERALNSAGFRTLINSVMYGAAAVSTVSFVLPGPFDKVVGLLNQLDSVLAQGKWIPLAILVFLGAFALAAGKKDKDGKNSTKWTHVPLVFLIITYLGSTIIEMGIMSYDLNRVTAQIVGGLALVLLVAGVGLMFKKGTGEWERGWKGMGLVLLVVIPGTVIFIGSSQSDQLVANRYISTPTTANAASFDLLSDDRAYLQQRAGIADSVIVNGRKQPLPSGQHLRFVMKACPKCGVKYRLTKADQYQICSRHFPAVALVWPDQVSDTTLARILAKGEERDVTRLPMAGRDRPRTLRGGDLDQIAREKGGR
jgi:hypothetical protein